MSNGLVTAPGCFDVASAKFIEAAGFDAVYCSGNGIQASLFGRPNIEYATLTEYIEFARRVVDAVDLPVIMDGERGFGNEFAIVRTIREFERSGVAAVHIEDTASEEHALLLKTSDMARKIQAAKYAQEDPDFVLIARTDALQFSIDEAIERANAYVEAGADVVMPLVSSILPYRGSTMTAQERQEVHRRLLDEINAPLVTHSPHGLDLSQDEARALGYAIYVIPHICLGPAAQAYMESLQALKDGDLVEHFAGRPPMAVRDFGEVMGMSEYQQLRENLNA